MFFNHLTTCAEHTYRRERLDHHLRLTNNTHTYSHKMPALLFFILLFEQLLVHLEHFYLYPHMKINIIKKTNIYTYVYSIWLWRNISSLFFFVIARIFSLTIHYLDHETLVKLIPPFDCFSNNDQNNFPVSYYNLLVDTYSPSSKPNRRKK